MATIRRVCPGDLFKLNLCNLDALTENYDLNFYLTYLMKWPSLFQCIEEHGQIVGYSNSFSSAIKATIPSQKHSMLIRPHFVWRSNGQTRILPTPPQQLTALPPLARPYHSPHYSTPISTSRLRIPPHASTRDRMQSIRRLVRRPLRSLE